jgi:hypothetical protein
MVSKLVKGIVLGLALVGAVSTVSASAVEVNLYSMKAGDRVVIDFDNKEFRQNLFSFVGTNPVFVDSYLADEISNRIKERKYGNFDLQLKDERMFNIDGEDFHVQEISIIEDKATYRKEEGPGDIIRAESRYELPGHIRMFCILYIDLKKLPSLGYQYPTVKIVEVSKSCGINQISKKKHIQIAKLLPPIKKSYF